MKQCLWYPARMQTPCWLRILFLSFKSQHLKQACAHRQFIINIVICLNKLLEQKAVLYIGKNKNQFVAQIYKFLHFLFGMLSVWMGEGCVCVCVRTGAYVCTECFLISTCQGKQAGICYNLFFHNLLSQASVLLPLALDSSFPLWILPSRLSKSFLTTLSAFRILLLCIKTSF